MWQIGHSTGQISLTPQQGRGRGAITMLDGIGSIKAGMSCTRRSAELLKAEEIERGGHDGDQ
jgi:hypothetical protein